MKNTAFIPRDVLLGVALSSTIASLLDSQSVYMDPVKYWPFLDPDDPKANLSLAAQLKRDPDSGRRWSRMKKQYQKHCRQLVIECWILEKWLTFSLLSDDVIAYHNLATSRINLTDLTEIKSGNIPKRLKESLDGIAEIAERNPELLGLSTFTDELAADVISDVWMDFLNEEDFRFSAKQMRDFRIKNNLTRVSTKYRRTGLIRSGKIKIEWIGRVEIKPILVPRPEVNPSNYPPNWDLPFMVHKR